MLDDVIHILIAAAGEVDQNRSLAHRLGKLDAVRHGVRALDRGDNALKTRKLEEGVDGFVIVHHVVLHAAYVVQKAMLGAAGRIVKTAGNRIYGARARRFRP